MAEDRRRNRLTVLGKQGHSEAEVWAWILETERLIEEMKAAPNNPSIDWVQSMLEEVVERKRRQLGFIGGQLH